MADRYWVGGSGNWDATSTANWSATSGGSAGASAPTSADNVIFDAGSDAGAGFTVTLGTGAVCADITVSGLDQAMIFAGGGFTYSGSLSFPATNLSYTATGVILGNSTTTGKTLTTNGVSLSTATVRFLGVGGEWTLGSALTCGTWDFIAGTFNSNNFNITAITKLISGAQNKTINLGSTTFTIIGSYLNTATNLTYNAGTSLITFSNSTATFGGNGFTYYNVTFTSSGAGTHTITGANTFNDLTFTSLASTGIRNISIGANQTVTGTLTLGTANTAIRRMFMRSDVIGTPITITATTMATIADVDFRDINNAGTTWTGTRLGNCGGNTGITFDAGKTVYWNLAGAGQQWSATGWALTSGGAPAANNFPLAQDTAIFDNTGLLTDVGFDRNWNVGTVDFSARTLACGFGLGVVQYYGDLKLSSAVTPSLTNIGVFCGNGNTQAIVSSGKVLTAGFTINKPAGSLVLGDALTSNGAFTLTQGTLDLNNFDLTCLTFNSTNSNTRSIAFGTGEINVTGNASSSLWLMDTATNFTLTGEPNVNFTYSGGTGSRNIRHATVAGGSESNAINVNITAGTDIVNLAVDANKSHIKHLNYTGFSGSIILCFPFLYGDLIFSSAMTLNIATTLNLTFASAINEQKVTFNGKTADWWFVVNTTGTGLVKLLDNMTIGASRNLNHTSGTLDLNDFNLTTGTYSSVSSNTRQLDFGTGDLNVTGASFTVSGSNFTTAGTGSVSMNSASSKTFAGGGFTYPTLNQGGTGTLTITGANTFANISNTVQPCTITFPAGQTTSVQNFTASGTAGNLVTLNSSTLGTQWTLAKV